MSGPARSLGTASNWAMCIVTRTPPYLSEPKHGWSTGNAANRLRTKLQDLTDHQLALASCPRSPCSLCRRRRTDQGSDSRAVPGRSVLDVGLSAFPLGFDRACPADYGAPSSRSHADWRWKVHRRQYERFGESGGKWPPTPRSSTPRRRSETPAEQPSRGGQKVTSGSPKKSAMKFTKKKPKNTTLTSSSTVCHHFGRALLGSLLFR